MKVLLTARAWTRLCGLCNTTAQSAQTDSSRVRCLLSRGSRQLFRNYTLPVTPPFISDQKMQAYKCNHSQPGPSVALDQVAPEKQGVSDSAATAVFSVCKILTNTEVTMSIRSDRPHQQIPNTEGLRSGSGSKNYYYGGIPIIIIIVIFS